MATYTRTEDADFITFTRADGLAGWRIYKHGHLHAEEWMPWGEAPNDYAAPTPAAAADHHEAVLEILGHTVVAG